LLVGDISRSGSPRRRAVPSGLRGLGMRWRAAVAHERHPVAAEAGVHRARHWRSRVWQRPHAKHFGTSSGRRGRALGPERSQMLGIGPFPNRSAPSGSRGALQRHGARSAGGRAGHSEVPVTHSPRNRRVSPGADAAPTGYRQPPDRPVSPGPCLSVSDEPSRARSLPRSAAPPPVR
jgi:hypothetical protein